MYGDEIDIGNKKYNAIWYMVIKLQKDDIKDQIRLDRFLLDLDKMLNPELDPKDCHFDIIKDNMRYILHVTSRHPSKLVDYEIKPMSNLAPEIQTSVPHYRENHISRFIYFNPSVVKATLFHFFHKHIDTFIIILE